MKANNLTFRYYAQSKQTVLNNLSFEIPKGKISLLVGRSGCGKSTLAYVLSGLYPQHCGILSAGEVTVHGRDVAEMPPCERAKYVSQMFQNPELQFCMSTLQEELIFTLENIGLTKEEIDQRIEEATELVQTSAFLTRAFHTLSGGEKQRCALTCIVALQSEYVILDEPFANLDADNANQLLALIAKLNKERGISFLVVDHNILRWIPMTHHVFLLEEQIIDTQITNQNITEKRQFFQEKGLAYPPASISFTAKEVNTTPHIVLQDFTLKGLLQDVNVSIQKSSMVAILGASGCGKTTLLKSFYGKTSFQGSIILADMKVVKKNYRKLCKKLGLVMQNPQNQFVTQKVIEEVAFNSQKENYLEYLKEFGLFTYQNYSPYMLSQGQQRKLAVLSVLLGEQEILLLDEPTYAQDNDATQQIMQLLSKKAKEEGLTIVFTTHDVALAYEYADQILQIEKGRVYEISRATKSIL